jgi:uncharacterized protein (DUF1501 family)
MSDCNLDKRITRRQFLTFAGGLTAAGFGALPRWVREASAQAKQGRKVLIVLFQRGAADGLNIVPPFNDEVYRKARPSIKIEAPIAGSRTIDLDGKFGLHPKLASLMPLWKDNRFAIVQAAGSPEETRSHFDAQDYMESGTPGVKVTQDGWLNRALVSGKIPQDPMAAISVTARLPRTLSGNFPVLAMNNADQLKGGGAVVDSFESMYDEAVDSLLSGPVKDLGEARKRLKGIPKFDPLELEKMGYPKGRTGRDFYELARVIKADLGLRVGFLEMGGWDHHYNEGGADGQLGRRLDELGGSAAAFFKDLGSMAEDVVLVTMTEFGRTIEENGNGGTDHGHASVMMLMGGRVNGGKIYGKWPGLKKENLFEERDLQVTTDFRQVLSEVLFRHLGVKDLGAVFPGGVFPPLGIIG